MSSLMMSTLPSLLSPQRLAPLKKKPIVKKRNRSITKRVLAAGDDTKPKATPDASKGPGYQVNGTPSTKQSEESTAKTVGSRLLGSMKFRGGAPELITGRCAMIAIPSVIAYEMMQKEQFLQLMDDHKLLFGAVIGLIALASLLPIARGAKNEAWGFMTPQAELINGRAAMIGILSILILEAKSGTNFF